MSVNRHSASTNPEPSQTRPLDDDMLDHEDTDSETETPPSAETVRDLRRQANAQARQMTAMMETINQLTAQLMATPNERTRAPPKPKMATPEKYEGGRSELRAFLTNIDLYCEYNEVPNDQEKILMASIHMKGKAASWMQPYVEDYLCSPTTGGERKETQNLFVSWINFKDEMGRIFGEVDAENQAEKAITRLKQTKSVSAYTAEFKQLQSRIDWDDAALRTVFENGLKETIKDSLVHHDKPGDLHALIELATRIDNRLWERAEQRSRSTPTIANTKRHRRHIRIDREGDVIMTDKVQQGSKDRRPRKGPSDGLSQEERKRRYDSKACLRCGEVGHFRRDCPKNETGKQGAVRIGMIRQGTPYPGPVPSQDDDVSDIRLYEEARLLDNETYEIIPPVLEAREIVNHNDTRPVDWKVTGAEVIQRLADKECWICGDKEHMAGDCDEKNSRIAITGPRAEEIAYQAIHEQPYFEDQEAQSGESIPSRVPEWKTKEHRAGHWTKCELRCRFHKGQRKTAGWRRNDEWHEILTDRECRIEDCPMHKKPGPQENQKATSREEPIPHECIHWSFCYEDYCRIHYDAKYGAGYFPRKRSGKRGQSKN